MGFKWEIVWDEGYPTSKNLNRKTDVKKVKGTGMCYFESP